ncbi:hypothetical protein [Streptomyces sp. PanSC9]|uniref:hypothetical protein n=1 Tax=Streptomyces sp. PanSC9 TaxID=1520461 RepID=UPI000F4745A3|nr:hypothetical protein [Streptomyces sp. PanSC9]ROP56066.1 hypothetical protein EDD94_5661 [Streptomyces sp. PanSC9]
MRASDISTRVQAAVAAEASGDTATGLLILAEHGDLIPAQARTALQAYATGTDRRLTTAARALAGRTLPADDVTSAPSADHGPDVPVRVTSDSGRPATG